MSQLSFSWNDHQFNPAQTSDCSLFVIAGLDGVSYMVVDAGRQLMSLKVWDMGASSPPSAERIRRLTEILESEHLFRATFAQKVLATASTHVSLVPKRMFSAESLPAYFHLLLESEQVHFGYEYLSAFEIASVFAIPLELKQVFTNQFEKHPIHVLPAILLPAMGKSSHHSERRICIHIRDGNAILAAFERDRLLYYNSFEFEKPDDFLYFSLLAFEQTGFSTDEVPCFLTGKLLESGDLFRILYRYIRDIRFLEDCLGVKCPDAAQIEAPHLFFDLLALQASYI